MRGYHRPAGDAVREEGRGHGGIDVEVDGGLRDGASLRLMRSWVRVVVPVSVPVPLARAVAPLWYYVHVPDLANRHAFESGAKVCARSNWPLEVDAAVFDGARRASRGRRGAAGISPRCSRC